MIRRGLLLASVLLATAVLAQPPGPALAEIEGIVAVVNDQPITELDLSQRVILLEILGDLPAKGMTKEQALRAMIDEGQIGIAGAMYDVKTGQVSFLSTAEPVAAAAV